MNNAAVTLSTAATSSSSRESSRGSTFPRPLSAASVRARATLHLHHERQDDRPAVQRLAQVAAQRLAHLFLDLERVGARLRRDGAERRQDHAARLFEVAQLFVLGEHAAGDEVWARDQLTAVL